jgi:hypothetical protein
MKNKIKITANSLLYCADLTTTEKSAPKELSKLRFTYERIRSHFSATSSQRGAIPYEQIRNDKLVVTIQKLTA